MTEDQSVMDLWGVWGQELIDILSWVHFTADKIKRGYFVFRFQVFESQPVCMKTSMEEVVWADVISVKEQIHGSVVTPLIIL